MKKLSAFFVFLASMQLYGMEGADNANPPQIPLQIVECNANDFLNNIDNEHYSQIRYFSNKYFPQSVSIKFGNTTVTQEQANALKQSLIEDMSLGNRVNEQRSFNLTPFIKTALENGYIEQYHNELAKHPLIAPDIKQKKQILNERIIKWNEHMEKQKVDQSFFVPNDSSYKKWIPGNAWIKYPAVIGLSVLFSEQIKYGLWETVKQAPIIWAKYFSRIATTAAK